MRPWFKREHYVEIEPGTLPVETNALREEKVRSAIARLGKKWVLRNTRGEQIEQLKAEGWDLV